jgi:hypothetical protein
VAIDGTKPSAGAATTFDASADPDRALARQRRAARGQPELAPRDAHDAEGITMRDTRGSGDALDHGDEAPKKRHVAHFDG